MSVPISNDTLAEITQDDKTMAMLAYLLGIVTGFVGPLILYLVKKDQSKFVAFHSLQALIFHVVVNLAAGVSAGLIVVLIGGILLPIVGVIGLIYTILAALAANRGEWYEIPVVGPFTRQQTGL